MDYSFIWETTVSFFKSFILSAMFSYMLLKVLPVLGVSNAVTAWIAVVLFFALGSELWDDELRKYEEKANRRLKK